MPRPPRYRDRPRYHGSPALRVGAARLAITLLAFLAGVPRDSFAGAADVETTNAAPDPATENEFPVALGSFSTTLIGSNADRTGNVRLAAAALDGVVLRPGDVLSFNDQVGPRSRERGYQPAPVILHESRQILTGGGVCQVASTLFIAALVSGLSAVERHRHSSPVDYIPLGQDATISWGVKDLKVRNDLAQRVRVRVEIVGSTLTARLEGEEPAGAWFEIETREREIPGDPGLMPGREIEVFRVRRLEGEPVGRDFLHCDIYAPVRPHGAR